MWTHLNENLPADARVLIWDRRGLYLEREYLWAWAMTRGIMSPESLDSPPLMRGELRRLGITHVAFHEPPGDPRSMALLRRTISETGCLEPYYRFGTTEVYEVDYSLCIP